MHYRATYDSIELRGKDDPLSPRPWDLTKLLNSLPQQYKQLLDLGTGTGFKMLPLKERYQKIICLDISCSMVNAAKVNLPFNNVTVIQGDNFKLPFKDHSFDTIISSLSLWDVKEIHRVLKPNGVVLIELIGCEDKKDFKLFFGEDEQGLRGQHLQYDPHTFITQLEQKFNRYFETVSLQNGFWNTTYSMKGILKLLSNTPTIRGYNYQKDKFYLKTAVQALSTPQGIKIQQNRMLLHAKNPK